MTYLKLLNSRRYLKTKLFYYYWCFIVTFLNAKKNTSLLFLLILQLGAAQTEIKFNLASALILTPNIGIEVQLSEKFGYQLDTSATFFDDIEGSPFQTTQIFNELRYYPKLKEGKKKDHFLLDLMLVTECLL